MNSPLILQTESVLYQLTDAINQLKHGDYKKPLETLSLSSIGQHVRHIIEFYQCMMNGHEKSVINYDRRIRDKMIEESREFALQCVNKILFDIKSIELNKSLSLEVSYEQNKEDASFMLSTTFERELVYNIEHAIHHMALIKIGIKEIDSELILPSEFGVAASTIKHQQKNHVHGQLLAKK
jgi:hypothetical protein